MVNGFKKVLWESLDVEAEVDFVQPYIIICTGRHVPGGFTTRLADLRRKECDQGILGQSRQ